MIFALIIKTYPFPEPVEKQLIAARLFIMFIVTSLLFSFMRLVRTEALSQAPCKTQTITASDVVNGLVPIDTSPITPFQSSAFIHQNITVWEHWYFDAVSTTSNAGITIMFFRDANIPGIGPLRASVDAVWQDGEQFQSMIEVEESIVEVCGDGETGTTRGWWKQKDGSESTFEFKDGNNEAKIYLNGTSLQGDHISGTFTISSFSQPRYPGGQIYSDPSASVEVAPLLYWNEGQPAGHVSTSVALGGREIRIDNGIGSVDKNWAAYIWDVLEKEHWWHHGVIGPYTFGHWKIISAIDNKTYSYAYLEEDGKKVFASKYECASDEDVGCAVLTLKEDGTVRGSFDDATTGLEIEYREKDGKGRKWAFSLQYTFVEYETPSGFNDEYSRFLDKVKGGEIGKEIWDGAGKGEWNHILASTPPL